jgi:hypothetical protein
MTTIPALQKTLKTIINTGKKDEYNHENREEK